MSELMINGVYYRDMPEFQQWQKDLAQTASFDDVSGWLWLLRRENDQTTQQRDVLLEACEAADATWNDNAPGPGLTERQAIAKLQTAIARVRGEEAR